MCSEKFGLFPPHHTRPDYVSVCCPDLKYDEVWVVKVSIARGENPRSVAINYSLMSGAQLCVSLTF